MGQRLWLVIYCAFLAGCGGCDGDTGGPNDPSDLYGYWYRDSDPALGAPSRTVFGFAPAADAPYEMQTGKYMLERDPMGKPVSEVFLPLPAGAQQFATYELDGDNLVQTVLGDVNTLPDTMYSTKISAFTAGESITLVTQAGEEHEYKYAPRCPALQGNNAWIQTGGFLCTTANPIGVSIAIDDHDEMHVTTGVGGGTDPFCPPVPTFTDLGKGCEVHQSVPGVNPYLSASAMDADGKVKIAVIDSNQQLSLLERDPHDDTGTTITQSLDASPHDGTGVRMMKIFRGDDGAVTIVLNNTAGKTHVYRELDSFAREDLTFTGAAGEALADVAMDPATGKLAAIGSLAVYREGQTNTMDVLSPKLLSTDTASIAFVGGDVHVAYVNRLIGSSPGGVGGIVSYGVGIYGVWDDAAHAWHDHELGPLMEPHVVSLPGGPLEVLAVTGKSDEPQIVRVALADDDTRTVTLPTLAAPFGDSENAFSHFAVARGPHTLAVAYNGHVVSLFDDRMPAAQAAVASFHAFQNMGSGHVKSAPGARVPFDCTTDCEVSGLFVGETLPTIVVPDSGFYSTSDPCDAKAVEQYGSCDVPLLTPKAERNFGFKPTGVRSVLAVGDANANSQVYGTNGTHVALGLAFNPGQKALTIGQDFGETTRTAVTFMQPAATLGGVAGFDRATRAGWVRGASQTPNAVAAATDGSVWAAFETLNGAVTIDGASYGTAGMQNVVIAHFAASDGAVIGTPHVMASVSAPVNLATVAVGGDGTATVIVASNTNLSSVGLPTDSLGALTRDVGGVVHAVSIGATGAAFSSGFIAIDRATQSTVVAIGDGAATSTRVVSINANGVATGSKTITGALPVSVAFAAGRIAVVVTANGSVDLGGGSRADGDGYLAIYNAANVAYAAGGVLSQATNYKAIGLDATHVFAAAAYGLVPFTQSGATLTAGAVFNLPSTGQLVTFGPSSTEGWVGMIVFTQNAGDFQIAQTGGQRFVLAELAMPPGF